MTDNGMLKRGHAKDVYGPLKERTLRNVLIKKLIDGYGYSDKLEIAKRLVDDFLDVVDRFAPSVERVKPGQMVWIARSDVAKQGYGKRSVDTEAKRVILSLVNEEERDTLAKGYNAMEISRMIDHELKNVETYIEDMERVKILASKDVQTISRLTRLSASLVREYLEIIRTYYPECMHLNSEEVNSNGKGN